MQCPSCGFENPGQMKFCGQCGRKLDQAAVPVTGERRPVVVLFADLAGYTALSEKLDPEQVQEILNRCLSRAAAIITRYDGTVDKYIGDEIMALFGVPAAHENDPERALAVALEIMQAMQELSGQLGLDLRMRQGLNFGEVVAGRVGQGPDRNATVIGDAVNVASRLEKLGQPGDIVVSGELHDLASAIFDFTDLGECPVRGRDRPVRAYRLEGRKERRRRIRGIDGLASPMVGRDQEMELLRKELQQVTESKHPAAVFIFADPGVGKSRLLNEFLQEINWKGETGGPETARRLFGRCLPFGGSSLGPISDWVKQMARINDSDAPAEARDKIRELCSRGLASQKSTLVKPEDLLGAMLGFSTGASSVEAIPAEQFYKQLNLILFELIGNQAGERPLLAVVEDLHWADELTLGFLEQFLTFCWDRPIFFIGLSRPASQEGSRVLALAEKLAVRGATQTIQLRELTPDQVRLIIHHLLEIEELPGPVKQQIVEHSGGNPLFVEEIIRFFIDQGMLVLEGDHWRATRDLAGLTVPRTLQSLLLSRIDQLPGPERTVLQYAAVVGKTFWKNLVAGVMHADITSSLDDLSLKDMIRLSLRSAMVDDIEYYFKHLLIQEAAYGTILRKIRVSLHGEVLKIIEQRFPGNLDAYADLLAYHADRADDRAKAIDYSIMAGDRNRKIFANQAAQKFYCRAVELMGDDPQHRSRQYDTGLKLAQVYAVLGQNDPAIEALVSILPLAQAPEQESLVLRKIGECCQRKSQYDKAAGYLEKAVAKLAHLPHSLEMFHAFRELSWINYLKGDIARARGFISGMEKILQSAGDSAGKEASNARASLCNLLAIIEGHEGHAELAIAHHLQQIEILSRLGQQILLGAPYNNLGTVYWTMGDYQNALLYLERSMDLAERTGDLLSVAISCNNLGGIYLDLNQPDRALGYFTKYLDINLRINNRLGDAYGHSGLGRIHQSQGQHEAAGREFSESLAVAREVKSKDQEVSALAHLAGALSLQSRHDQALSGVAEAQQLATAGQKPMLAFVEAGIRFRQAEDRTGAERSALLSLAEQLLLESRDPEDNSIEFHYLNSRVLSALGRHQEALAGLDQAAVAIEQVGSQLSQKMRDLYLAKQVVIDINGLRESLRQRALS